MNSGRDTPRWWTNMRQNRWSIPLLSGASLLLLLLAIPAPASAHGGGLDKIGCHHDRKKGGYHCHRGPLAGQAFSSKEEALKALEKKKQDEAESKKDEADTKKDQPNSEKEQTGSER